MKEATGELSTTVIAVVAIAAIATLFVTIFLPQLRASIRSSQACSAAGDGAYTQKFDDGSSISCNAGVCTITDSNGTSTTKTCN